MLSIIEKEERSFRSKTNTYLAEQQGIRWYLPQFVKYLLFIDKYLSNFTLRISKMNDYANHNYQQAGA